MRRKLVLLVLIITGLTSSAQSVKAVVDTTKIRIGEQFTYELTVSDTANVILPKLENLKGLEIVDSTKVDTLKGSLIQKFILTGFDSGAYYIPQQQVFIRNRAFLTDSILIDVASVDVDTTKVKMFEIKGVAEEPIIFDDYKHYIYWGLAALALLIPLIWYLKSRKRPEKEDKKVVPSQTPLEEALSSLEVLDKKLLWQNNRIKEYYTELTDIIRSYIEKELNIQALEQTTDEIISILSDFHEAETIETSKGAIEKLRALLQEADLVKFAKSKPLANAIEEDRNDAEYIIQNLHKKVVPIEEEKDELE